MITATARLLILLLMNPVIAMAQALPDPTRPAEYRESLVVQELPPALVDWKVTAIRISQDDRTAIVNGNIVRVGDDIGPARLLEIRPDQVILDYDSKRVAVRLFSDMSLRKPAAGTTKTDSES
jgi:hypothetical protein